MRVLLLHNPEAGDEDHEVEEWIKALESAGHKTTYHSSKTKGTNKALRNKLDLVIAAGGDGLVGRVARRLIGSKIPLSVFPLGTANNLARTLGFTRRTNTLIEKLSEGRRRPFDVGLAHGPWGKRYFFEGAGAGLFADYLKQPRKNVNQAREPISKVEQMRRHVVELRRQLQDFRAKSWTIALDEEDFSGRYLLWQAMNIRSVGPVLRLAPSAKTDDGQLDFVWAEEEDRAQLLKYLDARLAGVKRKFPLRVRRFSQMRLYWKKFPVHFDDEVWPDKDNKAEAGEIDIRISPSALWIWNIRK